MNNHLSSVGVHINYKEFIFKNTICFKYTLKENIDKNNNYIEYQLATLGSKWGILAL